jgi:hypothetical protein
MGTYKSGGEMWVLRLDWTGVNLTFDCEGGCVLNMAGMIA